MELFFVFLKMLYLCLTQLIVEEPAEPLQPSSLAVVHRQQRYCQPAGQVDHAVGGTVEYEEGDGVERDDGHHPEHLLVEAAPVPAYHEYGQRGGTTPVGGAGSASRPMPAGLTSHRVQSAAG